MRVSSRGWPGRTSDGLALLCLDELGGPDQLDGYGPGL